MTARPSAIARTSSACWPEPRRSKRKAVGQLGMGQNETTRNWTAGFGPCFHLPGFHFGHLFLTHCQLAFTLHSAMWVLLQPPNGLQPAGCYGHKVYIRPTGLHSTSNKEVTGPRQIESDSSDGCVRRQWSKAGSARNSFFFFPLDMSTLPEISFSTCPGRLKHSCYGNVKKDRLGQQLRLRRGWSVLCWMFAAPQIWETYPEIQLWQQLRPRTQGPRVFAWEAVRVAVWFKSASGSWRVAFLSSLVQTNGTILG